MAKSPGAEKSCLRIQLLGGFAAWIYGERVPEEKWRLRKTRSLVKLLALAEGHRLHRDQILDALWPDSDLPAATNNLHQTLHAARKLLERAGPGCLRLADGFLNLWIGASSELWVDVEQFELAAAAAASARARGSQDPGTNQAAIDLYQGDLLPEDLYEEWTLQQRDTLRMKYQNLLLELAGLLETRQEYSRAIEVINQLLAIDRVNEEAHIQLMRLQALSGRRGQALQQFQTLREVLQAELQVSPGVAASGLYEQIRDNHLPASRQEIPSPLPVFSPHHNLPNQLTSFIGREEEINEVCQRVQTHHLVTLTGAGGAGKTRLALRVAEQLLAGFEATWLVELAAVNDPNLVARAVADTLNILEQPGQELTRTIVEALRPRSLLLLLDNCEHVISGASTFAAKALKECPKLHILATSRETLGIAGELPYRCPSLTLPDERKKVAADEVGRSEAARLFVERARLVRPEYCLDEANAAAVAQIVRRLDGIPLAIELAAARMRMLTVDQIADRLKDVFHLLTGGSRSALPRHQTLEALIDWSFNLLSIEEQSLLLQLSVFAGGWTLEAAEAVCGPLRANEGQVALGTGQVVDLLGWLIDKSLVQFEPSQAAEPRYRMLETVRQFTRERLLETGGEQAVRERHLDYFLSLSIQAEPHLRSFGARQWLDRLDGELDNLRIALEWSSLGAVEKGLQLAAALLWFWHIRSHTVEPIDWLEKLLHEQERRRTSQPLDQTRKVARGRALNVLCYLKYKVEENIATFDRQSHQKQAIDRESQAIFEELSDGFQRDYALTRFNQSKTAQDFEEARRLFQAFNDLFWVSECDQVLMRRYPLDDEKATFYYKEYLSIKKAIGDQDGEGGGLFIQGFNEFYQGNIDQAIELSKKSLACFEAVGNWRYAALTHGQLVEIYTSIGNYPEAACQSEIMQAISQKINDILIHISYQIQLARRTWSEGDFEQSQRYCEEGLKIAEGLPGTYQGDLYYYQCRSAISQKNASQARTYLQKIIQAATCKDWQTIYVSGLLAALEGRMTKATILFGAHETFDRPTPVWYTPRERSEYDQALAAAHSALGEAGFSAAWEEGSMLSRAQALQLAQEILDH